MVNWSICEEAADKGACAPNRVSDHFAAAKVLNLEAQFAVALVCFKQWGVGVGSFELDRGGKKRAHFQSIRTAAPMKRVAKCQLGPKKMSHFHYNFEKDNHFWSLLLKLKRMTSVSFGWYFLVFNLAQRKCSIFKVILKWIIIFF